MRILCIGGGPAGLYAALVVKRADPQRIVRVVERNRASDTFGWGVVFSDQTLGNLATTDSATERPCARSMMQRAARRPIAEPSTLTVVSGGTVSAAKLRSP